jgi:hypothetical protein
MVFYQMFKFICGKNEVNGEEQNNSTNSIKIPQTQRSQKMSNKYKPVQPAKDKYIEKIPNIERTKPNIERTKPNIEAFIRNYNEIQKKGLPHDEK